MSAGDLGRGCTPLLEPKRIGMYDNKLRLAAGYTRWFRGILAFLLLMLGLCPEVWAQEPFAFPIEGERALVRYLRGDVRRQTVKEGPWSDVNLGAFVQAGERVMIMKAARLELELPDKSIIRFDEETDFRLVTAGYDSEHGKRDVQFSLALGKTWANIQQAFGRIKGVQVTSANAIVGVRGTIFRMNVASDLSALVKVYRGKVAVSKPHRVAGAKEITPQVHRVPGPERVPAPHRVPVGEWVRIVEAMQQITVSPEGIPSVPRPFTMEEDLDDWVQWNLERDRQI